eukprot:1160208-Pelagomonas_calceolata.AAC.4
MPDRLLARADVPKCKRATKHAPSPWNLGVREALRRDAARHRAVPNPDEGNKNIPKGRPNNACITRARSWGVEDGRKVEIPLLAA